MWGAIDAEQAGRVASAFLDAPRISRNPIVLAAYARSQRASRSMVRRAVHDIVSHGSRRHGFDRHGEFAAWLLEDRMYTGPARWALATELHGEHSVLWTSDRLAEHKATLLDPRLLSASRARVAALERTTGVSAGGDVVTTLPS